MNIIIDDTTLLSEIQQAFSKHFPYLKLEFFGYESAGHSVFTRRNLITDTNQSIDDIRHVHRSGHVSIDGHLKVSTLEKNFRDVYGINVQVFRKSGKTWLETTATDDWTLAKQNEMGSELESLGSETMVQDYDQYHEQQ